MFDSQHNLINWTLLSRKLIFKSVNYNKNMKYNRLRKLPVEAAAAVLGVSILASGCSAEEPSPTFTAYIENGPTTPFSPVPPPEKQVVPPPSIEEMLAMPLPLTEGCPTDKGYPYEPGGFQYEAAYLKKSIFDTPPPLTEEELVGGSYQAIRDYEIAMANADRVQLPEGFQRYVDDAYSSQHEIDVEEYIDMLTWVASQANIQIVIDWEPAPDNETADQTDTPTKVSARTVNKKSIDPKMIVEMAIGLNAMPKTFIGLSKTSKIYIGDAKDSSALGTKMGFRPIESDQNALTYIFIDTASIGEAGQTLTHEFIHGIDNNVSGKFRGAAGGSEVSCTRGLMRDIVGGVLDWPITDFGPITYFTPYARYSAQEEGDKGEILPETIASLATGSVETGEGSVTGVDITNLFGRPDKYGNVPDVKTVQEQTAIVIAYLDGVDPAMAEILRTRLVLLRFLVDVSKAQSDGELGRDLEGLDSVQQAILYALAPYKN